MPNLHDKSQNTPNTNASNRHERTNAEASGTKSTPGSDPADMSLSESPNEHRGPQGGLGTQGQGIPMKKAESTSTNRPTSGESFDEGTESGRESQHGMGTGNAQHGKHGTANEMGKSSDPSRH